MKARLNLTIDDNLHKDIKYYAESNNVSISELVETFFKTLIAPAPKKNIIDLVEQLKKPVVANEADLKELFYKEQSKKYGF